MHCPFCNYNDTKVVDSRLTADNLQVRRRRECLRCNSRFSTYETIELNLPRVVKKDNAREAFNLDKLKKGFYLALEKRPIASDLIEKSIDNIVKNIRSSVEKEIDSKITNINHVLISIKDNKNIDELISKIKNKSPGIRKI